MQTTLYVMVGLPASGKSQFAKEYGCPIVSSDSIRLELFGDEEVQSHNQQVFQEAHKRIFSYLDNNTDVIYDATNLSKKHRLSLLNSLSKNIRTVAIVMLTDLEIIYKQNRERFRHVPEDVIKRMLRTMTLPTQDEGWDKIYFHFHEKNKKTFMDYFADTIGFDQDNPHHTLTLDKHMHKAAQYVLNNWQEYNIAFENVQKVWLAALLHDIGKPICKTYTLWSGKTDTIAHYYNHAEVGAYLFACSLFYKDSDVQDNYLSTYLLIKLHMAAFEKKDIFSNIKEVYGEEMLKMYKLLNDADKIAH